MSNSNPRPVNVSYLVVGLIFLGISGSWALQASGAVDTAQVQWLLPLVLVGAGIVGLVAFAAKGLSRGRSSDEQPAARAGLRPVPRHDRPAPNGSTTPNEARPDHDHRRRRPMTEQHPSQTYTATKRLTRSRDDRWLGGVCGGIAAYTGIDATLVRLIVVVGTILGFGSLFVAYLVAWVLMPEA